MSREFLPPATLPGISGIEPDSLFWGVGASAIPPSACSLPVVYRRTKENFARGVAPARRAAALARRDSVAETA